MRVAPPVIPRTTGVLKKSAPTTSLDAPAVQRL